MKEITDDYFNFPVDSEPIKQSFGEFATAIIDEAKKVIKLMPKAPKAILLVGGMSASAYLRDKICAAFPKMSLLQPAEGTHDHVIKGV